MAEGGTGPIAAIILFVIFVINWFIWLGQYINVIGDNIVTSNNLTGVEAFAFSNLNFTLLICLILGMMGWMYFAGSRQ